MTQCAALLLFLPTHGLPASHTNFCLFVCFLPYFGYFSTCRSCSAMEAHAMKSLNAIHNQKVSCQKSESSPCWALCCGVPAMFILPLALVHQHNFHLTLLGMWMWLPVTSSSYSKQIQTEGLSFWQRGGNPACITHAGNHSCTVMGPYMQRNS